MGCRSLKVVDLIPRFWNLSCDLKNLLFPFIFVCYLSLFTGALGNDLLATVFLVLGFLMIVSDYYLVGDPDREIVSAGRDAS